MFQPAESLYNVINDKQETKEKKPYKPKKREIFNMKTASKVKG
jgi:hypothetical protein